MDLVRRNGKTPATPPPMVAITPDALARALAVLTDDEFDDIIEKARGPRLITLTELVAEGLGDNADRLAKQLGAEVITDDIGRRAVTRDTARRLIAEREEKRARQREEQRAKAAEARRQKEIRQAQHDARINRRDTGLLIEPPTWSPSDMMKTRAENGGWQK